MKLTQFVFILGIGIVVFYIGNVLQLGLYINLILSFFGTGLGIGYLRFESKVNQEKQRQQRTTSMMEAFALLKVLIHQGLTPYQAFQTVLQFVDPNLADALHQLLLELDQDSSLQPYLNFAKPFQSIMIEQLLFSMYQLSHQGGQASSLHHFRYLFDQADHQHYQSRLQILNEKMQSANQLVMIATGLIAFSLLVGVMQLIGGMLYGA
jgi:Flp pilus assembly protein TadB